MKIKSPNITTVTVAIIAAIVIVTIVAMALSSNNLVNLKMKFWGARIELETKSPTD